MKSKRLPDRVHVVSPPSNEYAGGGEAMGDHSREIVRALAKITDRLKRNEIERDEVMRELRQARKNIATIEDRSDAAEKAYLTLENKIKAQSQEDNEALSRQGRFEKSLKEAEDKLVKTIAGQTVLEQKIANSHANLEKKLKDVDVRADTMSERINEAVAYQTRIDRRLEAIAQDKTRMLRKVERLEEIVTETQDALRSKAMVLLTDQGIAGKTSAALEAPSWQTRPVIDGDEQPSDIPFGRKSYRMQALGTASMIVAALMGGWMINHFQSPNTPQIAILDGEQLARFDPDTNRFLPLSDDERAAAQAEPLSDDDSLFAQQTNVSETPDQSNLGDTQRSFDNVTSAQPIPAEAVQEQSIQPTLDYTDDSQLLAALEENPERLAQELNAIEPGASAVAVPAEPEAVVQEAEPVTEPQQQNQVETPASTQNTVSASSTVNANSPIMQQDPQVASQVQRTISNVPLSQRAQRDSNLPSLLRSYEDQAIQGVASAQHDLAAVYTAGRGGVPQNFEKAAFWFQEAALNNVANASYNLGVLYHQGLGVEQDLTKALYWYKEAAKSSHPEALYNLGIAHIEGIGTEYNPQTAAAFFELSADGGIMEAAYNLGLIYENGLLGQADNERAVYWFKVAANQGSEEGRSALAELADKLQIGSEDIDRTYERFNQIRNAQNANNRAVVTNASYTNAQELISQVQERLGQMGLYPGPSDGIMGPKTADAIRTYQSNNGLSVTGEPSRDLLKHLLQKQL